jgi:hypothetical protein
MPKKKKKKSTENKIGKIKIKYDGDEYWVNREMATLYTQLYKSGFEPIPTDEYKNKYTDDYEYIVLDNEEEVTDFYNICQKNDPKNEINIEHAWYVETKMKRDDEYYMQFIINFPKTDIDFLTRCFQNHNDTDIPKETPKKAKLKKIKYKDNEVEVDEDLAPLILEIWKAEFKTLDSFSKISGRYVIRFENWSDAKKFSNIVREQDLKSKNRVLDEWDFDTIVKDMNGVKDSDELDFAMAVKMPVEDVKMALKAMERYNFRLIEISIRKLEKSVNASRPLEVQDLKV